MESRVGKYDKIVRRAEEMGVADGQHIDYMMDIESADLAFNMRLDDWLAADDFEFLQDFMGIQYNIVRDGFPASNFGQFVPHFAGTEH